MASKRGANAQQKRRTNQSSSKGGRQGQSGSALPARGSAAWDIMAVVLIVVAVAMIISLVSPSSAPVTNAVGRALVLCFGVGALLCPIAIIAFAATFFVDGDDPLSSKVATGLALIVVSVLGMISLRYASAGVSPDAVISLDNVGELGGYVGGGVAWILLKSVGQSVGYVILAGVIITGVIVCGFSVSGAVAKVRGRAEAVGDSLRLAHARRREAAARATGEAQAFAGAPYAGADYEQELSEGYDSAQEPPTSFIGSRKTSVLTRGRMGGHVGVSSSRQEATQVLHEEKTRLIHRRRHPDLDVEEVTPAEPITSTERLRPVDSDADVVAEVVTSPDSSDEERVPLAVPDFIKNARQSTATAERPHRGSARAGEQTRIEAIASGNAPKPASASTAAQPATTSKRKSASAPKATSRPGEDAEDYELPPFSMLSSNPNSASAASSREELEETKRRLQSTLEEFGLSSKVVDYISGPLVTTFRIEMGEGERVNKIRNLEDDIALTLAAEKVRIFAPIAGTSYVGIEIPNHSRSNVHLGDVLPYASGGPLEVAIGRDSGGKPVVADIAKMPHMLVAGTTGSGKSVMINSMIMSLLMRSTPKQVRLIMVDPKRVEFSCYNGLPHLYVPVVTDPRQAASALQWAVSEMERRLKVFERAGARNISVYNNMCKTGKLSEMDNPPEPMPYIVVIIDELSDLMMTAGKDVEASIVRIAQLARAAGIHLVIATQRPSANVVTGLIKSNIDSRCALKVSSGIDSRVILDETGAERLLGNGDMLFKDRGLAPRRVLGCYTSDSEIEEVVSFIRDQAEPDYHEEILSQVVPGQPGGGGREDVGEEDDPLVWEAAQIVVDSQLGSTSGLQRRLKVGYARAGRIMDMLEAKGVVGPPEGSKPREVLLDKEGLEDLKTQDAKYREV